MESTIILIGILYLNIIIIVYAEVVKARQKSGTMPISDSNSLNYS